MLFHVNQRVRRSVEFYVIKKRGESKKRNLQEYMTDATALVREYIPPAPERIQKAVNSGNFSVQMLEPSKRVRLEFRSYLKTGDTLSVDMELPTDRLLGVNVSSYLDDVKDAIQLEVAMGILPDGTVFTKQSTLTALAKDVTITIENSGHLDSRRGP